MITSSERVAVRLGMVGLGGFGHYALQHFAQVQAVRPVCLPTQAARRAVAGEAAMKTIMDIFSEGATGR